MVEEIKVLEMLCVIEDCFPTNCKEVKGIHVQRMWQVIHNMKKQLNGRGTK